MKTDTEWNDWLNDPLAMRVVLLEVLEVLVSPGTTTSIRMSTGADYTSPGLGALSHFSYLGIARAEELFAEELTLPVPGATPGGGGLSQGSLYVENPNGIRDDWYNYTSWTNRRITGVLGDMRWALDDFRTVFDGTVAGIAPQGSGITLKLRDKLQRLNGPMLEDKLGGSSNNKDAIKPYVLGEVHNLSPLLINEATPQYQLHIGRVQGDLEVRANGVPVSATVDAATGTFALTVNPQGAAITASVKGDAPGGTYVNTIGALIRRAITGFGKATDRLADTDLDLSNLAQFDTDHPVPVGISSSDRQNVIEVCQALAGSVGAELVPTPGGLLKLVQLQLPATSPTLSIYPQSMEDGTFTLINVTTAIAAVKLGFNRNYTVQPTLETGIPQAHKELFAQEWLTATAVDDQARLDNRLSSDPVNQDNTQLLRRVDADPEALRRLNMWKTPRKIFEFTVLQDLLGLSLGQQVTVFHDRYGLAAGVNAVVIGRTVNFKTLRTKIRIIV